MPKNNNNKNVKVNLNVRGATRRRRVVRRAPLRNARPRRGIRISRLRSNLNGRKMGGLPIAYRSNYRSKQANLRNVRDGVIVSHKEYIGSVGSTLTEFNIKIDEWINPGNKVLFPWLAGMAFNYETYTIQSMKFTYSPTCPTTTVGLIAMMIDYDAADHPPTNLSDMLNSANAISFAPYENRSMLSSKQQLNKGLKERYIADGVSGAPEDVKTLYAGSLYVACQGTNSSQVGQLFIEYSVLLKTPSSVRGPSTTGGTMYWKQSAPTTSNPFLSTVNTSTYSGTPQLSSVVKNTTYDSFRFGNQYYYYHITFIIDGTGVTGTPVTTVRNDYTNFTVAASYGSTSCFKQMIIGGTGLEMDFQVSGILTNISRAKCIINGLTDAQYSLYGKFQTNADGQYPGYPIIQFNETKHSKHDIKEMVCVETKNDESLGNGQLNGITRMTNEQLRQFYEECLERDNYDWCEDTSEYTPE